MSVGSVRSTLMVLVHRVGFLETTVNSVSLPPLPSPPYSMLNPPAVSGKCGHNFHKHCISQWIRQESARGQCPMCRQSTPPTRSPPPLGALPKELRYKHAALVGLADPYYQGSR